MPALVHWKPRGSSSIAVTWFESTRRGLAAARMSRDVLIHLSMEDAVDWSRKRGRSR
jgi:hypothetical protein